MSSSRISSYRPGMTPDVIPINLDPRHATKAPPGPPAPMRYNLAPIGHLELTVLTEREWLELPADARAAYREYRKDCWVRLRME